MSTVEPTWTGRPCPWCGGDGYHNDYLVSVGMTACQECGIALPGEAWDAFSDAMALARAVEAITPTIMDNANGYELRVVKVQGRAYALLCGTKLTAPSVITHAATPAAALIALAGEVTE